MLTPIIQKTQTMQAKRDKTQLTNKAGLSDCIRKAVQELKRTRAAPGTSVELMVQIDQKNPRGSEDAIM